ncbi:alpha/beta hydrolase-fold protein [Acanthopleuribacter pedis]|uniref:Esterase n=1 Tax=Acanthopleuribacter pedis TaxID=442870 RepID=A0A8J7U622_9BACT|nr:alpha/beta hydrolase-fold protein [Acanthopleuribacter pedis]MBO1323163.1 hypothetical protein [Acanthopleuribacter pedis]
MTCVCFFSGEAFRGREWGADETMDLLNRLAVIDKVIVVGIYTKNRMTDDTAPGSNRYGKAVVNHIKTRIDRDFRTLPGAEHTAAMGSSLDGLESFFLAWEYPGGFSKAICMSSTFSFENDLMNRVAGEPKRPIQIYLDSGYPRDNFESTQRMRDLLLPRGYRCGQAVHYLSFPGDGHHETDWRERAGIPFQFMFGKGPGARMTDLAARASSQDR